MRKIKPKTDKEIIREIINKKKITKKELSVAFGHKSPSSITNKFSDKQIGFKVDNFLEFLDYLGYEVVIREKGKCRTKYIMKRGKSDEDEL